MDDWVTALETVDEVEIHDVLTLVLDRFRQLYPEGEMRAFWVEYGDDIYEQFDNVIAAMEALKKRIGPVLLKSSERTEYEIKTPSRGYVFPKQSKPNRKKNTGKIIPWKK